MVDDTDLRAAEDEADDSPHVIEVGGEEFEFRRLQDWPAKCFDMLQDGRVYWAVTHALVDYGRDIDRLDALMPTMGELTAVAEQIEKAEGVGRGNSSRSARSSRSTGRR